MSDEGVILGLLAAFAGIFIFLFIIMVVFYVLFALGMFKIAKTLGKGDIAFLAWIPIAQTFLLTLVLEDYVHEGLRGKFTLVYAISWVGSIILGAFFLPLAYVSMIILLYGFYVLTTLYSKNALAHTIIAIVTLGMSVPISVFRFRNRQPFVQQAV